MNAEKRDKYNLKQLIIEIPKRLHKEIKAHAALRNITMKTWVCRHIVKGLREEDRWG